MIFQSIDLYTPLTHAADESIIAALSIADETIILTLGHSQCRFTTDDFITAGRPFHYNMPVTA